MIARECGMSNTPDAIAKGPLCGWRAPFGTAQGGLCTPDHKELVDLDVDYIVPMHCTSEPFYEILKAELPKKLIPSYTGTRLVFCA